MTGLRVLITRPRHQSAEFAKQLAALGHEPVVLPLIEVAPPEDTAALDGALRREYDWVVFTSANAVAAVFDRNRPPAGRIAAVGRATAAALAQRGVVADFLPSESRGEVLADELGYARGLRILLPRADIAREELPEILRSRGAIVEDVVAYRTVPAGVSAEQLPTNVDVVTFFSPSAVRAFVSLRPTTDAVIACVGPVTAATARAAGLRVDVVADEYSASGLIAAITNRTGAAV